MLIDTSPLDEHLTAEWVREAMRLPGFRFGSGCRVTTAEGWAIMLPSGAWHLHNATQRDVDAGVLDLDDHATGGWLWVLVGSPAIHDRPGWGRVLQTQDEYGSPCERRFRGSLADTCCRLALALEQWLGRPPTTDPRPRPGKG